MVAALVVLEGLDGSGKSTVAAGLAEALGAIHLATPPAALRGIRPLIDQVFPRASPAATLWYAAGVAEVSRAAAAHMADGRSVVVDRYWLSTRAYARVLGCDLALPEVEALLVPATVTAWIEVPRGERARRMAGRCCASEQDVLTLAPAIEAALVAAYGELAARPVAGRLVRCDGMRPVDAIVAEIRAHVERRGPSNCPSYAARSSYGA